MTSQFCLLTLQHDVAKKFRDSIKKGIFCAGKYFPEIVKIEYLAGI